MGINDKKYNTLHKGLMERWGYELNEEEEELEETATGRVKDGERRPEDLRKRPMEESDDIFAPNHYCIHHGGVSHNGKVEMAEAVNHNYNLELARVTHYDMKLSDGTILENIAAEDIQVTDASLAEGHGSHPAKRDDEEEDDKEDLKESAIRRVVREAIKKKLKRNG